MEHVSPDLPPDRCPGLLRPHVAADGALVRLRAPGGRVPSGGLGRLSAASQEFADGDVHLTSRGNLQIRGISLDDCGNVPAGLTDAIVAAGFLPSPSHERVRNVVASPLSGLVGGVADIRPLIGALDTALCAEPALAELPGRFLFGLDDGRGDVAGLRCDLAAIADEASGATGNDTGRTMRIVIGGLDGPTVPISQVIDTLIDLALRFLQTRGTLWHVRQLPGRGAELGGAGRVPALPSYAMPYGVLAGVVSALVPLGILSPSMASALPDDDVIVTPWRGLVLPSGADPAALSDAGFVLSDDSAWPRVTACTGSPGCSLARGDTRALARRTVTSGTTADRLHIVGCERACGAPNSPHTLVFASRSTSHRSST
ncbi:cobalamin biosynthesis protein CobG [Rhodococcus artemisiae]|uniref:Cobalamin biosynthesis protein CobG n=1 Tax=Rhodococcus artemisiae TaxID=714159 RepID=A0ABU7LHI6_9NOCA|nr:cobalamin biosynthesis protein CobG [Rhodococcus artemisiae]MEE2060998.1 cobalamin biosynthesis protein CobG [Rhodococcus artemisiae]